MKGISAWNYAPYKPWFYEVGDIYICRVAPDVDSIAFEWLPLDSVAEYSVYYRKRGEGEFICAGNTCDTEYVIKGLMTGIDYEFFVESQGLKSRVRIARAGEIVGTVVNYLHPDDKAYSFSGNALCSPSMVRCPDGSLLASMDVYGSNMPQNLSILFRSLDDGKTWHYVTELYPCYWGTLFVHKNEVYMLSASTEYGDVLIGRSTDNGKTFCTPTVLFRGSCKCNHEGNHKYPMNIVKYGGRLYHPIEWGSWSKKPLLHSAAMLSCDENADLLDPQSWNMSEPLPYNHDWPGTSVGDCGFTIEGTPVVLPDGKLYSIMRYCIECSDYPTFGRAITYRINTDNPDAPPEFHKVIHFPGNHSKFMIRYDEQSKKYYSLVSRILDHESRMNRNLLSLISSPDGENWSLVKDIIDFRNEKDVAFQYVWFEIEKDDIIFLSRTAFNGARNAHDANYSTFHRIENFRAL